MKKILVTGASGFLGSHVAEHFAGMGANVFGLVRREVRGLLEPRSNLQIIKCDVLHLNALTSLVHQLRPDVVVHLAAQSLPSVSWKEPKLTFEVNAVGTLHVLQAVSALDYRPVMILAGSSAEYAAPQGSYCRIPETFAIDPASPYGASKAAAAALAKISGRLHKIGVAWVRPFQIIGPRKTSDACSDFARGIVAIERGADPVLRVGNIEVVRDFLHVADAVRAIEVLSVHRIEAGTFEVFNICSGQGYPVRKIIELLLGHTTRSIRVESEPGRFRPADHSTVVGDNAKITSLGWHHSVSLDEALFDILKYWRSTANLEA